jgi:hypothetical protein
MTVLPLTNTTLEALAGYLLGQVLPQLKTGLVAAELEISKFPGISAIACVDLGQAGDHLELD